MTDLKEFVNDAIRTESRIDAVEVNEDLLTETISVLINAGNVLDQIKKHVFYGKDYDVSALMHHVRCIEDSTLILGNLSRCDIHDEEKLDINPRIFHSIVGIATESTELLEAINLDGEDMDKVNRGEEVGDLDWQKAIGIDELDLNWVTILETVIEKLKTMVDGGIIKRLGIVVRHHELGYRANAMVVWDVADDQVDKLGKQMGQQDCGTLCYPRPRMLP